MTRRTGHASQGDAAPITVRVIRVSHEPGTAMPSALLMSAGQAESTDARQAARYARPGCGEPLERQATGRPARYCSGKCRQAAHRARARAAAAAAAAAEFRDPPAVTKPAEGILGTTPHRGASVAAELQRRLSRPMADQLRSNRQDFLRRAARDLLRALEHVAGPDEPETRLALRDVTIVIDLRRDGWPPE